MTAPFLAALGATLAVLAGVVVSGIVGRRRLHYGLVVLFFSALGWAIWEAEEMGSALRFEGAAGTFHAIHLVAVIVTLLVAPAVVWSGVRLARDGGAPRARHRSLASLFVTLVLLTSVLGTVMTLLAEPVAADAAAPPAPASANGGQDG